nr:NADH-quinone oxidoreductase subunit L [bacterium]
MSEKYFLHNIGNPESRELDFYLANQGWSAWKKVVQQGDPSAVIEEVKKSGLRGRGGAGFPTGMKWSFVPRDSEKPKYL